ncbi:unnamed protein product [Paramecium sonneborni]|uniref:Uncharacterized protein n=1 Tax=Paramecium sonneborni TaxID=65129 RepID=A0A8S1RSR0_9CILI|nr:unnamed protein product [Paramecium sonneborni]
MNKGQSRRRDHFLISSLIFTNDNYQYLRSTDSQQTDANCRTKFCQQYKFYQFSEIFWITFKNEFFNSKQIFPSIKYFLWIQQKKEYQPPEQPLREKLSDNKQQTDNNNFDAFDLQRFY